MIRAARHADISRAVPLLARAFSSYRDALIYTPEVLSFFERAWWRPPHGVVAELEGELVGVAFVGHRRARFEGQRLLVASIGPVAVEPSLQRTGLGSALMMALKSDADLLTLTTNDSEGVRPFYEALGFQVLEHFVPWVRDLDGHIPAMPSMAAPRTGAIIEEPVEVGECFRVGNAEIHAIQWPVTSRRAGRRAQLRTCQVLGRSGGGPELAKALEQTCAWARTGSCELIWARPDIADGLPGFELGVGPGVSRMIKPRTALGEAVGCAARCYTPSGPSP